MAELIEKIKKESLYIFCLLIALSIILKLVFYNEGLLSVLRISFSIFWIFILPGFYLLYYWHESLDFIERLVLSAALGAAVIGTLSYYLGLAGLHIKWHMFVIPILMLVSSLIMIAKMNKKHHDMNPNHDNSAR